MPAEAEGAESERRRIQPHVDRHLHNHLLGGGLADSGEVLEFHVVGQRSPGRHPALCPVALRPDQDVRIARADDARRGAQRRCVALAGRPRQIHSHRSGQGERHGYGVPDAGQARRQRALDRRQVRLTLRHLAGRRAGAPLCQLLEQSGWRRGLVGGATLHPARQRLIAEQVLDRQQPTRDVATLQRGVGEGHSVRRQRQHHRGHARRMRQDRQPGGLDLIQLSSDVGLRLQRFGQCPHRERGPLETPHVHGAGQFLVGRHVHRDEIQHLERIVRGRVCHHVEVASGKPEQFRIERAAPQQPRVGRELEDLGLRGDQQARLEHRQVAVRVVVEAERERRDAVAPDDVGLDRRRGHLQRGRDLDRERPRQCRDAVAGLRAQVVDAGRDAGEVPARHELRAVDVLHGHR